MSTSFAFSRKQRLFVVLGFLFLTNALVAEFIGAKIFSLESSLGLPPAQWVIGGDVFNFDMTAGVILWPFVFILTDLINEYYGKKGVKWLSYLAAGMLVYAFIAVRVAMKLDGAEFWLNSGQNQGLTNMSQAFNAIFGQGLFIIMGSLVAFLVGQLVDAFIFEKLKSQDQGNRIWVRATGSTLVSQLIDSYVVLVIAFWWGAGYPLKWVIQVGSLNYVYKVGMALLLLPLLYGAHRLIDRYLAKDA